MNKKNLLNYIAILAVCFFAGAGNYMSAAIQTFKEVFPDISQSNIMMVSTLPGIVSVPVMLLAGRLVGKKLSYRFFCICGSILMIVGGLLPCIISTNWTFILLCRAILGMGTGCFAVRNTFIIKTVPPEKQADFTGYSTVLLTVGGTLAGPVVGALVGIKWNLAFLYNIIPIIVLVLVLAGLKNPEEVQGRPAAADSREISKNSDKLSWKIYFYTILQMCIIGSLYPMAVSGTSIFMNEYNLGSASIAGIVLSTFPLFGVIGSLFLPQFIKLLKRFLIPVMSLLVIAGQVLCLTIHSLPVMFISIALAGVGYHVIMGSLQVYNGQEAPQSKMAVGSTLILAAKQLGIFLSSYYIIFCAKIFKLPGLDIESAFLGCILIYSIITIFTLAVNVVPEKAHSDVIK